MEAYSYHLRTTPVTIDHARAHATPLLDVDTVHFVTEYEPARVRAKFTALCEAASRENAQQASAAVGTAPDGTSLNEALGIAVRAIRRAHELEPHAYVVVFAREGFELPVDLRPLSDEPDRFVGFVMEPRAIAEVVFDFTQLQGNVADSLSSATRDQAVSAITQLSADGQEFTLTDTCSHDERFAHTFSDGTYRPHYRVVEVTEADA